MKWKKRFQVGWQISAAKPEDLNSIPAIHRMDGGNLPSEIIF